FLFSTPAIAWWLSGRWPKAHEIAAVALPLAAVAAFRILDTGGGGEEALASTGSSLLIHPFEGRRNPGGVVLVLVLVALGLAGAYRLVAGRGLSVRQHWPLAPGVLLLVGF